MFHFIYIGDFAREAGHPRFWKDSRGTYRPVVTQPMDRSVVSDLLRKQGIEPNPEKIFPADWPVVFAGDFLVANHLGLGEDVIHFIRQLVAETGCTIIAIPGGDVTIEDLVQASNYRQ
jgi:hypothetical protein